MVIFSVSPGFTQQFELLDRPLGTDNGLWDGELELVEVTGDTAPDLVVVGEDRNGNGRFLIFKNNTEGLFGSRLEPLGANKGLRQASLGSARIDSGPLIDLSMLGINNSDTRQFITWENTGSGLMQLWNEPLGDDTGLARGAIAWAEAFDDSGVNPVVSGAVSADTNRLVFFRNDGGGTLVQLTEPFGANRGFRRGDLAWGDVDQDGIPDLAATGIDSGGNVHLKVFENSGSGTDIFQFTQNPLGADKGLRDGEVSWADFDSDGDPDLSATGADGDSEARFLLFENQSGSLEQQFTSLDPDSGLKKSSLLPVDFENDGNVELLAIGRTDERSAKLIKVDELESGSPTAGPILSGDTGFFSGDIDVADVDGDSRKDIAVMGRDGDSVPRLMVYRNVGFEDDGGGGGGSDDDDDLTCIMAQIGVPFRVQSSFRDFRDILLTYRFGRYVTWFYYHV